MNDKPKKINQVKAVLLVGVRLITEIVVNACARRHYKACMPTSH